MNSLIAAAHELKTPLVLVRQLNLELAETDDQRRRDEIIRRIRLTTERSLRLVDNLTKSSRLEDGLFSLEPVQLNGLCHEVVDELTPLSRALGQTFDLDVGRRPLLAVGSRDLLRSLLIGLVDNALQYNPCGQAIKISAGYRQGRAVLAVADNGPVINLAEFRRLRATVGQQALPMADRPLSSGLGLMIAQQFATVMQGSLKLRRHRRGGLTLAVDLPISAQLDLTSGRPDVNSWSRL